MEKKENEKTEELKNLINEILMGKGLKGRVCNIIDAPQLYRFEIEMKDYKSSKKYNSIKQDLQVFLKNKNVNVVIEDNIYIDYPKSEVKSLKRPKTRFKDFSQTLDIGVGLDNKPILIDLKRSPHMIISGETNSGKTVFLEGIVRNLEKQGNTIHILDTKVVSFKHLEKMKEVVVFTSALEGCKIAELYIDFMEERYKILDKLGVKSVYDLTKEEIIKNELWPQFLVIDELADLFSNDGFGEIIESLLEKIAVKGRASGLHLILATQRADSKIFSPLLKANMSNKVVFKTSTASNSRIAIDSNGAELLRGEGDYYLRQGANIIRGQGYYEK